MICLGNLAHSFAPLSTQSPDVLGQTVPPCTSASFVEFPGDHIASQPKRRKVHVVADNLSTHKTHAVRTFLVEVALLQRLLRSPLRAHRATRIVR